MAKKKKTQLKPVQRGFATQSVPKKVVEPEPEVQQEIDSLPATPSGQAAAGPSAQPSQDAGSATVRLPADSDQFDPEKAEEQSLQNLVDRFQERTEKEIVRTIKV